MRKLFILAALFAFVAVANVPAQTAAIVIRETNVSSAGGVLDDTAFEPGIIAIDTRSNPAGIIFVENNQTSGTSETRAFSYPFGSDPSSVAATTVFTGMDASDTGTLQAALAVTNNIYFRQGAGSFDAATGVVYVLAADKGTSTSEFVGDGDPDTLFAVDVDDASTTVVSTTDGVMSVAYCGGNTLVVELDASAGAAEDAIGFIDLGGALPAAPTSIVSQATLVGLFGGATAVDVFGVAPFGSDALALVSVDGTASAVVRISDPAGSPTASVFVASAALDATALGALSPSGIDTTASGEIIVLSSNTNADVAANEGIVHIRPDGTVNLTAAASLVTAATGDAHFQNFDNDSVAAWDAVSGDVNVVVSSQANAEYLASITIPAASVPVELSAFQLD